MSTHDSEVELQRRLDEAMEQNQVDLIHHLRDKLCQSEAEIERLKCKLEEVVELFQTYQEDFGLCDHDFPGEGHTDRQCEFEVKFCEWICGVLGHDVGPDQCGKPEHDYCYRCNRMRTEIEGDTTA